METQIFKILEQQSQSSAGISNISFLLGKHNDNKDLWLFYELGGQCLGKQMFEVKGEFFKGERIYGIQKQPFFLAVKQNLDHLRVVIRKLAEAFDVLQKAQIVHADIKPDNILIDFDHQTQKVKEVKLIDFGSSFMYNNPTGLSVSTPEYLAPEILDFLENRQ